MTSSYEPQVGDRISIEGTVVSVGPLSVNPLSQGPVSLVNVRIDGMGKDRHGVTGAVFPDRLTLVERPEPKVSIELTAEQLRSLAWLGDLYGVTLSTRKAVGAIREVLDECF